MSKRSSAARFSLSTRGRSSVIASFLTASSSLDTGTDTGSTAFDALEQQIRQVIRANTTPRHVPAKILAVGDIPRTISGKIVELAVRNVVHGEPVKNTDALANPQALEQFRDRPELA